MPFTASDIGALIHAITFATDKHRVQRRKGRAHLPYINHPIHLLNLLWDVGAVRDIPTLLGAVLHDTLEDTATTPAELAAHFGANVLSIVQEVTDDRSLPKSERKRLQVEHALQLSVAAKHIKLADKIDNVRDLIQDAPTNWSRERVVAYVDWAENVVAGLRGTNARLEAAFDAVVQEARKELGEKTALP